MNISISYNWLKSHFDKDIPNSGEFVGILTKNLAEVEGVEIRGDDTIFDIKIMPDRGHDLLCHKGIAREVSVLSGVPLKNEKRKTKNKKSSPATMLRVFVEDVKLCPRYMGLVVENIKVGDSPAWLRTRLESVGQRSINNIVDITNFVMLEIGQPMHAFDLGKLATNDKQQTTIEVRKARGGEKITTLDEKEIILTPDTLVIADSNQALAIAGIKGGKDAVVDGATTSIIFEAANFNAVHTRKTAQRVGIRTDSSKRFEHGLSPSLVSDAMSLAVEMLVELCPDAIVGEAIDVYPEPQQEKTITMSVKDINGILGTTLSGDEVEKILNRLDFKNERRGEIFVVTPPLLRLDLVIKEDIAEEIGRVYGFDKVIDAPLPPLSFTPKPLKEYYYANMIRDTLVAQGFSEVYTSSFQKEGVFAVENPLALDKAFLRKDLATNIKQSLELNTYNAPLLGLDEIKIFEIGKAFPGVMQEKLLCVIGIEMVKTNKKKAEITREALEQARTLLGEILENPIDGEFSENIFEFDLGAFLDKLPEPKAGEPFTSTSTRYTKFSPYPFMLRDIALWVPEGISVDDVLSVVSSEAGELLRTKKLFDVFTKEFPEGKKTSYAFNLVFQSYEKTLSDEEINSIMERITTTLSAKSWQVR
ncbi:MAG: phenylalanine--tRNA ligase subunit beta [Candidatus Yonathbacteria bacterium]|nr:phenylalanine--tRNA ligase subunit beta [Candidatus Yonathbacteria bacterium]